MQKNVQENNVQNVNLVPPESVNNWNDAICETERLIKEKGKRLAQLRQSVEIFKRLRDEGIPFPGANAEKTERQS